MNQTKFARPPSLRVFSAFSEHAYFDRTFDLLDRLQLPHLRTYEPMRRRCRIIRRASKPGETDWDPATNCVAVFPSRFCAEKENFPCTSWLPGGGVCTVQVDLPYSFRRGDAYLRQSAVSFDELCG